MSKDLLVTAPTFNVGKVSVGRAVEVTRFSSSGKLVFTRIGKVTSVKPDCINVLLMDDDRGIVNLHAITPSLIDSGDLVIKLLYIM